MGPCEGRINANVSRNTRALDIIIKACSFKSQMPSTDPVVAALTRAQVRFYSCKTKLSAAVTLPGYGAVCVDSCFADLFRNPSVSIYYMYST